MEFHFDNFRVINVGMENFLQTFNTIETWIDVDILAALKGISKRAVRLGKDSTQNDYVSFWEGGSRTHWVRTHPTFHSKKTESFQTLF